MLLDKVIDAKTNLKEHMDYAYEKAVSTSVSLA